MESHKSRYLLMGLILFMLLIGCGRTLPEAESTPTLVSSPTSASIRQDFEAYFQALDVEGSFVLYDLSRDTYVRYNPERCAERFIPASTFKIMNTLIGLETGVITDENTVIEWDGTRYPIPAWNQDHTLATAMQNSVVWYYQEVARRVGRERLQHYVDAVNYGNRDISGQIDSFWLDGGLRISQEEQIEFLRRLYDDELPFSQRSMTIVKQIIVLEQTDGYTLSGKTGVGQRDDRQIGWFVGYLEENGGVYFFAANVQAETPAENFGLAGPEITRSILQDLGLLQQ